jgi:hypothetical protein
MSFHNRRIHGYSEIRINSAEYAMILKQYGYTGRGSSKPTNPLPEKTEQDQNVLRVVEGGRGSACERGQSTFNSPEEREFYYEQLEALKKEGGRSPDEIELLAHKALEEWRKYDDPPF